MAAVQLHIPRRRTPAQRALRIALRVLRVLLYVVICVIFLVPFAWMLFGSLRAEREIFRYLTPFSWRTFVPIEWTLDSYLTILGLNEVGRAGGYNFGQNVLNSLIVSTAVVFSSLFFNTMGAYFFARLPFPKKNWLLIYMLATFLIPFEVTMVPLYIVVRNLHMDNTMWALIAVGDKNIQVLPIVISTTIGQTQQYWGRNFAGSSLATVPVVVIFLLLQRYYVQGVATTGV